MKKFLSAVLICAIIFAFIPTMTPAANASVFSVEGDWEFARSAAHADSRPGIDGTALIWRYNGPGGDIVIPSTLGGMPVTLLRSGLFRDDTSITSVVIPDSLVEISYSVFRGCTSLTSVTIGSGVTEIDAVAFEGCTSLTSIIIPNSVINIGLSAFGGCTSLRNVTLGNSVTEIGAFAFDRCTSLTSITIPNSVTTIGRMAFTESGLTSVTIPGSVQVIGDLAFFRCYSLKTVIIEEGVAELGENVFMNCFELAGVTIPRSVKQIETHPFIISGAPAEYALLPNVFVRCYENSYAHTYAIEEGIPFELITDTPPSTPPPLFGDLAGVSNEGLANIEFVYEEGLMSGSGGNFMPTQAARNAQFLAILSRLSRAGVSDGSPWFAPYVDWARDFGIIEEGEFDADGDMAREDMALWMYRYITICRIELPSVNGKPDYQDIAGLSEEQRIAAEALFDWGIITGATRGEVFGTGASSERVALANVLARFVRMLP